MQNKYAYWIFRNAISEEAMGKIKEIASQSEYKVATTDDGEDNKKARSSNVSWSSDQYLYEVFSRFVYDANESSGWKYDIDYFEAIQIATYEKNQYYSWHDDGLGDHSGVYGTDVPDDNYTGKVRKLSLVACVSNGYVGGDLELSIQTRNREQNIFNETLYPEMKYGDVIVFPSYIFHRSTPVTEGTKHSVAMWCLGAPFK